MIYTQLLNRRGGIESDLTVTRLAADRFQLVTGTAFGAHDLGWLRAHLPGDGSVYADDVTAARACLCIWGPRSREIVQALTKTDLAADGVPVHACARIAIGDVPCLALRVTYVGELGLEIYCPTEFGAALWDALWDAGRPHGLVPAGYRAIDSLRLEKGYRAWGTDITPETTPDEAGLGFAVRIDKPARFVGQDALRAARAAAAGRSSGSLPRARGSTRRLSRVGAGPARGRAIGRVTSGGFGSGSAGASPTPTCPQRMRCRARGRAWRYSAMGPRRGRRRAALRPGQRAHPQLARGSGAWLRAKRGAWLRQCNSRARPGGWY